MRTTLTIDEDNAAVLERLRQERGVSLKDLVNQALRLGLRDLTAGASKRKKPFRTPTADLGRCLLPNVDNIGEVLDIIEGPMHR